VPWTVVFADEDVEAALLRLQPGFVARLIRYAERMETYGPDLGMPHTRAMGSETPIRELALARERLRKVRL
jgi:hypothetical protein